MYNFEEIKQFIKKRYSGKDYQVFNTRNIIGDRMKNVYNKNGISIDECSDCEYIEIFGITKEEYSSLYTDCHKLKKDI